MITAARSVSSDEDTARRALKLGPKSIAERFRNLEIDGAPTMPAIERYTGVLYDPLDAQDADAATRAWWDEHAIVQSAMFGPVRAGDPIPAYRLSHDSRLPGVRLAGVWPVASSAVLAGVGDLVLDLRSEGYRALGPVPGAVVLRVVSVDGAGRRRALNHWNKTAKGRLVAAMGRAGVSASNMDELAAWAAGAGIVLDRLDGAWELVAESLEPATV